MKTLTLALLIMGCHHDANDAEIMAKGQNPDLVCESATTDKHHIQIAVCTATDKDHKASQDFVAVYSAVHPFQAFPVKTSTQIKADNEAAAKRAAEEAQKVPPADAGVDAPVSKK